jgi:hypothetical protein
MSSGEERVKGGEEDDMAWEVNISDITGRAKRSKKRAGEYI